MTIQRFRRKPIDPGADHDQVVARYVPGEPLDDLLTVARMMDPHAEITVASFSTTSVLVARFTRIPDHAPLYIDHECIKPGHFLAYSPGNDSLYESDDQDLRHFYDEVPE